MNTQVLSVLILSWLIGSVTAGLLIWYNAGPRLVYTIFIGLGLLSGCAYDWVYGMGGSSAGWLMLVVCPLLWLQGAWLVTRVLPRWFTPAPPRPARKQNGEVEA
jgi:hypothetical protein